MKNGNGYTMIELLVGLSLFLMVIVPSIHIMTQAMKINKGMDTLIASCILEQESANLRLFPEGYKPELSRRINHRQWFVKTAIKGNLLKECTMRIYKDDRYIQHATFYYYHEPQKH